MKAIIKTKTREKFEKHIKCSEEEFITEITYSKWLIIENTYEKVYLRAGEIESITFENKN